VERIKTVRLSVISGHIFILVFILGTLLITGCGEEPGRVRVRHEEVVGVYEAKFDGGLEVLELKNDQTYVQDFTAGKRSIHHTGKWRIENHVLGGSDVVLISSVVRESDKETVPERTGDRVLNVHNRSGKLALALNEPADWYFVRIR
jgi:hypothetical protein